MVQVEHGADFGVRMRLVREARGPQRDGVGDEVAERVHGIGDERRRVAHHTGAELAHTRRGRRRGGQGAGDALA